MKEILAKNLQTLFSNSSLNGKRTYKGKLYEVWEVSDENFKDMCGMSEVGFRQLCHKGMWRSSEGSNMGVPCVEYKIKGNKIMTWDGNERSDYMSDCKKCLDKESGVCAGTEKDFNECFGRKDYSNLLEYLCNEIGCSQPRNVCALAVDLAKYNDMSVGELFAKYEG